MAFKRLTRPQREAMKALRELGGEMMVTPQDARSLAVLACRGLVRYRRDEDGVRLVVLRETTAQARARKREERQYANLDRWLRYHIESGR
jgi:DNA-binding MarR family transcriptional regulator